jgi:hypothetical protein
VRLQCRIRTALIASKAVFTMTLSALFLETEVEGKNRGAAPLQLQLA